jgi:trk system potassium uptake protein TrkH
MNYRMIIRIIGKIMCVEAAFMLPSLIISLCQGEHRSALGFGATMAALAVVGLLCAAVRARKRNFYTREGMVTVGLAWIIVSLFGALPFYISGSISGFTNCLFESVSGLTTTGATVCKDVEALPMGILLWRSLSHWVGGMGVLVFVLALGNLNKEESGAMFLLRAESPGPQVGKLVPRMHRSARILYGIYVGLTLLQTILLLLGNVPLFDSVNIALASAGTGGFGIKNSSLAGYSAYAQTVTAVFMLVCSVNFNLYYLLLLGEFRRVFKNEELRLYLLFVFGAVAAIYLNIRTSAGVPGVEGADLRHVFFQVSSIISTTGFTTLNYDTWPHFSRCIILLLMFAGGMAGSTSGGVKTARILIVFKAVRRAVYKTLRPNEVRLIHVDGELIENQTVTAVCGFTITYSLVWIASMLLISLDGFSLETSLTASLSCICNIGPGLDAIGPNFTFADFSVLSKAVMCVEMLLGRLEIYPLLILLTPSVWKK